MSVEPDPRRAAGRTAIVTKTFSALAEPKDVENTTMEKGAMDGCSCTNPPTAIGYTAIRF